MGGYSKRSIAHYDSELHDPLAEVQTLMPVSVVKDLLQPRLVDDGHDPSILVVGLLQVEHFISSFDIIVAPSFNFTHMLLSRIRHPMKVTEGD